MLRNLQPHPLPALATNFRNYIYCSKSSQECIFVIKLLYYVNIVKHKSKKQLRKNIVNFQNSARLRRIFSFPTDAAQPHIALISLWPFRTARETKKKNKCPRNN